MVRIQSGHLRGQLLHVPSSARPTSAKLRQSLMNILAPRLENARVLDLFAGSGAFGLEALSRGAQHAVFVDSSSKAFDCIRKNIAHLKLQDHTHVIKSAVEKAKEKIRQAAPFDVVFADPPYDQEQWFRSFFEFIDWPLILSDNAVVCLEVSLRLWNKKKEKTTLSWGSFVQREYSESALIICTKEGSGETR